jgi:hypothetical protein
MPNPNRSPFPLRSQCASVTAKPHQRARAAVSIRAAGEAFASRPRGAELVTAERSARLREGAKYVTCRARVCSGSDNVRRSTDRELVWRAMNSAETRNYATAGGN